MTAPAAAEARLTVASPRQTWAAVGRLLRRRAWLLTGVLLCLVGGSASALVVPRLLGQIVDQVRAGEGVPAVLISCAWILGVGLLSAGLGLLGGLGLVELVQGVVAELREAVIDAVLARPVREIEAGGSSDVISRVTRDVEAVTEAAADILPAVTQAGFTILLTIGGLVAIDPRLALAALPAVPVQIIATTRFVRRSRRVYAEVRVAEAERGQSILETVAAADTLRAYRGQDARLAAVGERSARVIQLQVAATRLRTTFWNWLNAAEFLALGGILIAGFLLTGANAITVGAATAGALYVHRLFGPIGGLLSSIDELQLAAVGLSRLVGVLLPGEPDRGAAPRATPAAAGPLAVRVRGLRHAYDGGRLALGTAAGGLSLDIAAGSTVALVGPSGSGKSTLAQAIAGGIAPDAGEVRLGGVPAAQLARNPRVALVTQESHLFQGSIAANLRLAAPAASDAELEAALRTVGCDWVFADPAGLAAEPEAAHLDGGALQQLALARVLLLDPDVLVLDEATAEGGEASAPELDRAVAAVAAGRTTVLVAHRLSQARLADDILVLEDGAVTERGRHGDLLGAAGGYAGLWAAWVSARPEPGTT